MGGSGWFSGVPEEFEAFFQGTLAWGSLLNDSNP